MAAAVATPISAPVVPAGTGAGAGAAPGAAAGTRQQAATLYVGDLNPDVEESDLYTAFNAVVEVQHIRIARDAHTRKSRGYAFVNFKNAEDAQRALQSLNYTSIKGRACRIMWAQRDPTPRRDNVGNVFVKNLGPKITVKELNETFKIFGAILSCKVATGPEGESKGYGFVHFQEAEAASEAIANVNGLKWEGQVVECKPYVPRENRSGPGWNNLFIKNVPKEWTETVLRETFAPFGEITSCKLAVDEAGKSKGFGFVCFGAPSSAQAAEKELNGKEFDGTPASPSPFKKDKATADAAGAGAGASSTTTTTDAATAATTAATATSGKLRLYVGRHIKKAERERLQKEAIDKVKREKAQQRANRNLWVGNLDESVDDDMLRKEFSKHGLVESAVVARDPAHELRSRLFGYVLLSTQEEANKALAAMNHKMVQGKPLYVRIWEPKETRAAFREQRQEASRNARGLGGARGGAAGGVSSAALSAAGAIPSVATANPAAVGAAVMSPAMMTYMARAWNNYATGTATQQDMLVLQQWFYMMYMAQLQMQQQQQQRIPNAAAAAAAAAAGMVPPAGGVPGGRGAVPTSAGGVPAAAVGRPGAMPTMAMGGAMPTAGGMPFMMPGLAGVGNMMMPQAPGVPVVVAGGVPSAPGAAVGPRGAGGVPRGGARAGPTRGAAGGAATAGAPAANNSGRPGASVTSPGSAAGRGPTAASVVRGGSATGGAPTGAAYRPGARNTDDSAAVPAPVAAAAPSAVAPSSLFASELVAAEPDKRKNMIGERLYSQIAQIDREKAGKITGMLLESIDESELLHLLEAAPELEARVREAQQVLHEAAKAAGGAAPATTATA